MPLIFIPIGGGAPTPAASLTTVTAQDFITRALRLIGVLDPTETADAENAEDAFQTLNDWIDSLGTQRLSIFSLLRTTKTLTAGTASYTIGIGGDLNVARPMSIESARLVIDIGAATPLEAQIGVITDEEWAGIAQKSFSSGYTQGVYYDHAWTAGLGRIYPWPVPDVSTTQLVLYLPTALTEFAALSTEYTFPPAWRRAIRYNLATELAADFHVEAPENVRRIATETMAWIKRSNQRLTTVDIDPALLGRGGMSRSRFESGNF